MSNTQKQIEDLKKEISRLSYHIKTHPKDKSCKVCIVKTVYKYNALVRYSKRNQKDHSK